MAFDRAAAKQAGYTDDEIDAYIAANPQVETKQDKDQEQAANLPTPEQVMGRSGDNPSAELDRTNENVMTGAMGVGMGAAAVGVPAALYYGGKAVLNPTVRAGANVVQQGMDLAQRGVGAMEQQAKTAATTEGRLQNRPGFGGTGQQVRAVSPTYNVPTSNVPQMRAPLPTAVAPQPMPGVPTAGAVIPQGMAPAPSSPSIMSRMRALAANKVLQGAGNLAKGSIGPGMAMYSGGLNTNEDEELRKRRMMQPTIDR